MTIPEKNIYAIDAQSNYLQTLAKEIMRIVSCDMERLSNAVIMLPSRRSGVVLKTELLNVNNRKSLLMPKVLSLGDIDETELELGELEFDLESASNVKSLKVIPKHKRIMLLAELVRKAGIFGYDMNKLSMHQSVKLAYSLAELIDDFQKYGNLNTANLKEILPEELSKHKQYTLDFISFIELEYPKLLEKGGYIDAVNKRNILIDRYINLLKLKNPANDIIIAGSSGSQPSTRNLIKAVLECNNGHFFLPYFDEDNFGKEDISKDNHQCLVYELLKYLNVTRDEIKFLGLQNSASTKIINGIFSTESLAIQALQNDNIWIIETDNLIDEAKIAGLIIREHIEDKKKTAFVTNNRNLAKLTREYLQKWNVNIDDSSGIKFSDTEEGNFILQICEFIGSGGKTMNLLSLLKNRFSNTRGSTVLNLEKMIREKNIFKIKPDDVEDIKINAVVSIVEKYSAKFKEKISSIFKDVYEIINLLGNDKDFYERENITEAIDILNFLINDEYSQAETEIEYLSEFTKNIFDIVTIRPKFGVTSSASILSPIEARLLGFDCVILGGLNYGSWPKRISSPWLSDNMKDNAGLPESDFFTSLSAHDFVALLHGKKVFITRSKKEGGEITVESPLLSRLKAYFKKNDLKFAESKYFDYLEQLERPDNIKTPQTKVYPNPPAEARPDKLSVTNIEKLIYNPYEIYVSKILKLKKPDDIEREGEARDYGTFIHDILERFTLFHDLDIDKITVQNFLNITDEVFVEYKAKNIATEVWLYNCRAIANDLINIERERAEKTRNIFCEKSGKIQFISDGKEFNISCKADRIEISNDNRLVIIDYKTGSASIPTDKDIKTLKKPQLLLELLIFENGSFEMIDKATLGCISEQEIAYFLISKSANGPKIEEKDGFDLELIKENLANLIRDLLDPNKPFLISPRPYLKPKFREYAHLERIEEN